MARVPRVRREGAALAVACALCGSGAAACYSLLGIDSDRYVVKEGDDSAVEAGPDATGDDVQDASDAQNEPDATVEPPGYECLAQPAPGAAPGPLDVRFFFNDVSSASTADSFAGTPVPGVQTIACSTLDLACSHPLTSVVSDDAGVADLSVPSGFDGYYQMIAQNYPSSIIKRSPQLQSENVQQGLVNSNLIALGPTLVGVTQDPNDGIVIVSVFDCASLTAAGLTFAIGAPAPNEQLFYFVNSIPTAPATSTDKTGSAIIFNVPPGTITVTATLPNSQTLRTVTSITRAGWVSFVDIRPDQATVQSPTPQD